MASEKLKGCPLCGGCPRAPFETDDETLEAFNEVHGTEYKQLWRVDCLNGHEVSVGAPTKNEAVKLWNTRIQQEK